MLLLLLLYIADDFAVPFVVVCIIDTLGCVGSCTLVAVVVGITFVVGIVVVVVRWLCYYLCCY